MAHSGVRKFVEVDSGRIAYAMTEAALSDGGKWKPDPSFSLADSILADPGFATLLTAVSCDSPAAGSKGAISYQREGTKVPAYSGGTH